MASMKIDAAGLDRLAIAFKAAGPEVKRQYRKGLKDAGKLVRDDAARRIASVSPPTAASLKVGTRGVNSIVVYVAGDRRIASLLEGAGEPGMWRHPLFGDRERWYAERRHPYLHPAWEAESGKCVDRMSEVIRGGLREAGISSDGRLGATLAGSSTISNATVSMRAF